VVDRNSNALWGMRFVWPIKADYRITYVSDDYGQTVISRQKRDYVWIMARTPQIPAADYDRLLGLVAQQGYDVSRVQRVPQRWPE
jgi:apolipoprotein D and lipocalin family protein